MFVQAVVSLAHSGYFSRMWWFRDIGWYPYPVIAPFSCISVASHVTSKENSLIWCLHCPLTAMTRAMEVKLCELHRSLNKGGGHWVFAHITSMSNEKEGTRANRSKSRKGDVSITNRGTGWLVPHHPDNRGRPKFAIEIESPCGVPRRCQQCPNFWNCVTVHRPLFCERGCYTMGKFVKKNGPLGSRALHRISWVVTRRKHSHASLRKAWNSRTTLFPSLLSWPAVENGSCNRTES